jgi:hypothetical protein
MVKNTVWSTGQQTPKAACSAETVTGVGQSGSVGPPGRAINSSGQLPPRGISRAVLDVLPQRVPNRVSHRKRANDVPPRRRKRTPTRTRSPGESNFSVCCTCFSVTRRANAPAMTCTVAKTTTPPSATTSSSGNTSTATQGVASAPHTKLAGRG